MAKSTTKDAVRLRERTTSTGLRSLYLDIYMNGRRSYEYLRLYLVPENTRADRDKNRETLSLAEAICAKRLIEIKNGQYGFRNKTPDNTNFYDYYNRIVQSRLRSDTKSNHGNWRSSMMHIEIYDPKVKTRVLAEITPEWVMGFRDYLETEARVHTGGILKSTLLSRNSRCSYFRKLKACLTQAYEEGLIDKNPCRVIEGFSDEEGTRMYLTLEEVQKLAATPCEFPEIKRAFLFSCLTGLRRSDILGLTWGDVYQQGEYTRIIFRQKKTHGQEYLDINAEAAGLLGERLSPEEHCFGDILTTGSTNHKVQEWCWKAGINKKISFHCARHTFATMMLSLGTDLYTVSKLLGHSSIATTQIYAKVLDRNKQEAVKNIPSIFCPKPKN